MQSHHTPHYSTLVAENNSFIVTDHILKAMNEKKITALILLDLSKAFDSIDHDRLLYKSSAMGASSATLNWFKMLSGRSRTVGIGSTLSDALPITHGVPQGAIYHLFSSAFT